MEIKTLTSFKPFFSSQPPKKAQFVLLIQTNYLFAGTRFRPRAHTLSPPRSPTSPSLLLLTPPRWSSKTHLEKSWTLPFGEEAAEKQGYGLKKYSPHSKLLMKNNYLGESQGAAHPRGPGVGLHGQRNNFI